MRELKVEIAAAMRKDQLEKRRRRGMRCGRHQQRFPSEAQHQEIGDDSCLLGNKSFVESHQAR